MNAAEKFGITIKTTAGYSLWSNGTVERHNQTLERMLAKGLDEKSCDLPTAVSWCISAKNSLYDMNGFSPFQLSIGTLNFPPLLLTNSLRYLPQLYQRY